MIGDSPRDAFAFIAEGERQAEKKKSADSMMAPRYSYVKYDEQSATLQAQFKTNFEALSAEVEEHLLPGRAKALVFTKLEEAYMWIGKAIRDAQVQRLGTLDSQEERTND